MKTARQILEEQVSEKEFQQQVIDLATMLRWKVYHTWNSRNSASGFPDLVLARERVIFAELKTENGMLSAEQRIWAFALGCASAEYYCWKPSGWDEIEETLR